MIRINSVSLSHEAQLWEVNMERISQLHTEKIELKTELLCPITWGHIVE